MIIMIQFSKIILTILIVLLFIAFTIKAINPLYVIGLEVIMAYIVDLINNM